MWIRIAKLHAFGRFLAQFAVSMTGNMNAQLPLRMRQRECFPTKEKMKGRYRYLR
jgi:hypothetical protein